MKKITLFLAIILIACVATSKAISQSATDSQRIAEIDKSYWNVISRTVKEGDFEGYEATLT